MSTISEEIRKAALGPAPLHQTQLSAWRVPFGKVRAFCGAPACELLKDLPDECARRTFLLLVACALESEAAS